MDGNDTSFRFSHPQGHHTNVCIHNIKTSHDEKADYFPGFTVRSHGISQRRELRASPPSGPFPDGQDGLRAQPHR